MWGKFYQQNNTKIRDLPDYVFVEWSDGYWVAVNYSSEKYELPVATQNIIIAKTAIAPADVTIWK